MRFTVDLNDNEVKILDMVRTAHTLYSFAGSNDGKMSRQFAVEQIVADFLMKKHREIKSFD